MQVSQNKGSEVTEAESLAQKRVLNLRGKVCPYTNLKTLEELRRVSPNAVLEVTVDNPTSVAGVVSVAQNAGHSVVKVTEAGSAFTILIRKAGA